MQEVFYIEDDPTIAHIVKEYLETKGFVVSWFSEIEPAKLALWKHRPKVVLLDWNMPDGSGDAFCSWIHSKWNSLPIVFITVHNDPKDIVSGFRLGADDYITKPFDLDVLKMRIRALIRRVDHQAEEVMTCGSVLVDKEKMQVMEQGKEVKLSRSEYELLCLLLENKGKTVPRERLLEQIWDEHGNYVHDNTLTVTMKRLREKLNKPSWIKTIRSFGYRIEEEE